MTLSSRISRLRAEAGSKSARDTGQTAAPLQDRLAHLRPERAQRQGRSARHSISYQELVRRINGKRIAKDLIRIDQRIPLDRVIGSIPLQGLSTPPLLPGEERTPSSLYIDTETTGLSGGSGTLAFLVGIAEVDVSSISMTQLLITSFAAETELLRCLNTMLSSEQRLVSYNGKSYDLPLLCTRFRMHKIDHSLDEMEHLDLLHPVRRLYGKRWENCRLTTVERRMLQFQRKDDLPGAEAPEAWFSWLQWGDGERLLKVVEHNRQDILSLALVHHAMVQAARQPVQWGVDMHGLGRWLMEKSETDALHLLQTHRDRLCDDGKWLLGYLLRRAEHWSEAVQLWEELAMKECVDSIERLAKYHEHISKDLHTALRYCDRLPGSIQDGKRRTRIVRKLKNQIPQKRLRNT